MLPARCLVQRLALLEGFGELDLLVRESVKLILLVIAALRFRRGVLGGGRLG